MKKKMILTIIAITLAIIIAVGFNKAKQLQSIQIVKTVDIKAPLQATFDMVRYLSKFPQWSPFLVQDPSQKYNIKGVDGSIGAQYHWNGNKGKDIGYQEIVQIDSLHFIGKRCYIQKPFVAKPTFNYYFTETTEGVQVKEEFKLESGLMDAFFLWLFGAKAEMEKTNQQGLDLLKKAVENKS